MAMDTRRVGPRAVLAYALREERETVGGGGEEWLLVVINAKREPVMRALRLPAGAREAGRCLGERVRAWARGVGWGRAVAALDSGRVGAARCSRVEAVGDSPGSTRVDKLRWTRR